MDNPMLTGQIFAGFFTINTILTIACYAITAFCLYKIAKRNNITKPWIAFIPIFQFYIIGKSIEEYEIFTYKIPKMQWLIFVVIALKYLVTLVPYVGMILGLAVTAIWVLILHKFFYLFDSGRSFLYAILCIFGDVFLNIPLAIILILIRDKNMINSPGTYEYPF